MIQQLPSLNVERRYIPFVAVHEFEALLFSDAEILADELKIDHEIVHNILEKCGSPESINNSPQTAPSKRLKALNSRFKKTTTGIAIAEKIGVEKMRQASPLFDDWLKKIELLQCT